MDKGTTILISAIVITKNEENSIARCLLSLLPVADEILVVDAYSTDKTPEICKSFGVKFFQHEWEGYTKTKNWANSRATNEYILSVDADEELSPELQQSILEAKQKGVPFYYEINRLTNYCGQWIRHGGWFPDIKPRLFDRRNARWTGEYVHERMENTAGEKAILLKGLCYHYSIPSIEKHIDTVNRYSTLAAEEMIAKGKTFSLLKLILSPPITFFKMYILKGGFLDGTNGLIIAVISGHYRFLKYAKMRNKAKG